MTPETEVAYLGFHGWSVTPAGAGARDRILVNPVFGDAVGHGRVRYRRGGPPEAAPAGTGTTAVVITGDSCFHLHLPSISQLPRSVPLYAAPHVSRAATDALELLGFAVRRPTSSWSAGGLRLTFGPPDTGPRGLRTTSVYIGESLELAGVVTGLTRRSDDQQQADRRAVISAIVLPGATAADTGARPVDSVRVTTPTIVCEEGAAAPAQLSAPFRTDQAAITALKQCRAFLPTFGRELILGLPGLAEAVDRSPTGGTLLVTLLLGPRGATLRYTLDATRMEFLPAAPAPALVNRDYRYGMTCHLNDFAAAIGGYLSATDLAAAGMLAWGPAPLMAHQLVEPLAAWSRPQLTWRHLAITANELMDDRGLAMLSGQLEQV